MVAAAVDRLTGPVVEKFTTYPETGPAVLLTCTTSGCAKVALTSALCELPLTIVMPLGGGVVDGEVTVRVKVCVSAPATAVTVAVPVRVPAFGVTAARPLASVSMVVPSSRVTGPLTRYCTG